MRFTIGILLLLPVLACSSEFRWGDQARPEVNVAQSGGSDNGGNSDIAPADLAVAADEHTLLLTWDPVAVSGDYSGKIYYKLIYSLTEIPQSTIDSIDDVAAEYVLLNWQADTTTYKFTNLNSDTTYHFALVARDDDGRRVTYPTRSYKTASATDGTSAALTKHFIKPPVPYSAQKFGNSVAIHGDLIAVGGPQDFNPATTSYQGEGPYPWDAGSHHHYGAVNLYRLSGDKWIHEAYLKAPNAHDGVIDGFQFGHAVAAYGDTVVVSALNERSTTTSIIHGSDLSATNTLANRVGAVYVFRKKTTGWELEAYLKAPNAMVSQQFGTSVAIYGDVIAVGAPTEIGSGTSIVHGDDLSGVPYGGASGAVYLFRRTGTTWTHEAYFKAGNNHAGQYYGSSIALSADRLVVGSMAEKSSTTGIINGTDLSTTDTASNEPGAAYVYVYNAGTWSQEAYLKMPVSRSHARFGSRVAIHEDTVAVSAERDPHDNNSIINGTDFSALNYTGDHFGAVYVFRRTAGNWDYEAYLVPPLVDDFIKYATSLAVYGDYIAVGAYQELGRTTEVLYGSDLTGTQPEGSTGGYTGAFTVGAVYMYKRSNSLWQMHAYVKPHAQNMALHFGTSVSLDESGLLVGAPGDTRGNPHGTPPHPTITNMPNSGAAFHFLIDP